MLPTIPPSQPVLNRKYKTMLCRHFQNGNCQLGPRCSFAHGEPEMRRENDPIPTNAALQFSMPPMMNMMGGNPMLPQSNPILPNYKTIKCAYFESGFCKNGMNCTFAHGDTDIRANGGFPMMPPQQPGMPGMNPLQSKNKIIF